MTFLEDEQPQVWKPPSAHATIWRYTTLAKFLNMLVRHEPMSGQLYFCRTDLLGDPFEGATPAVEALVRSDLLRQAGIAASEEGVRKATEGQRRWSAVSCWHLGDCESAALWQIYSASEGAVAIRSTYFRLRAALSAVPYSVGIGTVRYIDYARARFATEVPVRHVPLLHKRQSFSHEQELRAVLPFDPPPLGAGQFDDKGQRVFNIEEWIQPPAWVGLSLPIDIDALIESLYVSPTAPEWMRQTVEAIVRNVGFNFPVVQSSLTAAPIF